MINARNITLCTIVALVFSIGVPHATPAQTVKRSVPEEYRIVAKHLAAGLQNSMKASQQHDKRPSSDYVKEMDRLIFDFEKIKTNDSGIRRVVSLALPAAEQLVKAMNNIHSIPHMSGDEFLEYLTLSIMSGGLDNTGYTKSASRRDIIKAEEQKMNRAALELLRSRDLLPAIAKEYAPTPSLFSPLQVGFYETEHSTNDDILHITNNGGDLRDCTLEVKITGKGDASVTSVYFVERWAKGATLWTLCKPEQGSTVSGVATLKVSVLSPDLNTTINYSYDKVERGKAHAYFFKDVKLTARYSEASEGFFDNWHRYATIYMDGYPRLPPCTLSVTFDGEGKTYSKSDSGWSKGEGWTIYGNNKSEDKCKSFSAEVTFPQSDFKIKKTWTVGQ